MSSQSSFDYDPAPPELSEPACRIEVFRYTPSSKTYDALPNVQIMEIQQREGLEPPTARLEYITDDRAIASGWPTEFEQIMAIAYQSDAKSRTKPNQKKKADVGRYVVKPDERIVVKLTDAFGVRDVIFDGFAQAPQANVSPKSQSITFVAVGVAVRLFVEPVASRREAWSMLPRSDGASPSDAKYQRVVHRPARFNPDGVGNCTPESLWYDPAGDPKSNAAFPIFYAYGIDAGAPVSWTLAMAARYIIQQHLGTENEFCDPPDAEILDRLLNRRMPKDQDPQGPVDPSLFYDPNDPATYIERPITLQDFDMAGMRWPEALDRLLTFSGFAAKFVTEGDENGDPWTYIDVYRKDNGGPTDPKVVLLQPRRSSVDPSRSNVRSFGVVRDYKNAFNAIVMDAYPALVEVSVVLAMRGPTNPSDPGNSADFVNSAIIDPGAQNAVAYRMWYADELGEGHLDAAGAISTTAFDFADAFAKIDTDPDEPFLQVRRPGRRKLLSVNGSGAVNEAALYLSRDYKGDPAELWDGTGSWQKVPPNWELLKDRLGVKLTYDNLENWPLGTPSGGGPHAQYLRVLTSMAAPNTASPRFFLRLDTVIEADLRAFESLPSRKASALKWDRYRYLNGKGSFQQSFVHESSLHYVGTRNTGKAATEDLDVAADGYTWMSQVQRAGEDPSVSGPITLPWFTTAYRIGDRISKIAGRELSLQVNQGAGQGEAPAYPFVVGVTWSFAGGEETTLELSDHRAMPDNPHSRRR